MSALGISLRQAILSSMNCQSVLVDKRYQGALMELLQTDRQIGGKGVSKEDKEKMAAFFADANSDFDYSRSYLFDKSSGIAIIPMYGLLLNRLSFSGYGVTGYDYIRSAFNDALNAKDVEGIVFDINSGGGSVAGNFELADYIYENRDQKPMMGMINSISASGAYSLGSAIGNLVAIPSADVGSIGVYSMHMDISKLMDNFGVKATFIFAGDHKVDGNMFEPLADDVRADIQSSVDDSYNSFVALVAKNRNMDESAVRDTQARVYSAPDALKLGLIDSVADSDEALADFQNGLSGSTSTPTGVFMSKTTNPAGNEATQANTETQINVAEERQKAITEERNRRKAIMSLEETKGRESLANHICDNTFMSVEEAKGMLAASPLKDEKADAGKQGNHFERAMTSTPNPDVTNEDGNAQQANELTGTNRLLAAAKSAGVANIKHPTK